MKMDVVEKIRVLMDYIKIISMTQKKIPAVVVVVDMGA
jgi:hypothetical protein